ncbi:MAG: hypothetical protein AOY29_07330 [Alcanivorax borkumensis]|uniref:Mannitol operon repressor n=1 Tax=Alcanivorax borkumensis (strain ATCC 700651 / DSM 11573 / NCIMB 13689 / SK2) TaxID=393595 RepID=Q0VKY8_ALCBS|nr:hypothetical protein [Alcanivorax borkumensis]OJH09106.1 MAG: hypothetical protein AOY29_07330 [Alcanivorax borkumensis]CAL18160.1 unnamed protein product [Alcanivorax borkumensis SK2]
MSEFSGSEAAELFSDYYELISEESDRGAVIVAASILDESLGEILKTFLLRPSTKKDNLLEGAYAPLGSFSAKIELSFRLGIIRKPIRQQLMLFKSIRNDVAHRLSVASLQDEKCRSRLAEILNTTPDITHQMIKILIQAGLDISHKERGDSFLDTYGCRRTFDLLFSMVCMATTQIAKTIEPIDCFIQES